MKEYRIIYHFNHFGWDVLDENGAVVYETTTKRDAESWIEARQREAETV